MTAVTTTTVPTLPMSVFTTDQRLSVLIHAGSKVGKSTLSATAPKPILVLDAEGSWRFIPLRRVTWDPYVGPPPVYDGTWDVCIVTVREWGVIPLVHQWLTQYQLPFVTLVVDSITEIQRRLRENLKGTEAFKIQDWGVLLALMDAAIRGFRDLTLMPQLNVRCVVFVAETRRRDDGKWIPYMQGQISVALPYWVDLCGYLYPSTEQDANGQLTREVRQLLITPHPQYEAGERVQGRLGKVVTIYQSPDGRVGNDIERWMYHIFGVSSTPTTPTNEGS